MTKSKKLSEMTLEELWQLFPIFLEKPQEQWKQWYKEEWKVLSDLLPKEQIVRISHIGSTSIKGIWAKPIIDILVELTEQTDLTAIGDFLEKNRYLCMSREKRRVSFNKGYTENGFAEKVFHIHLRYIGDNDELYFRDYLNENPTVAKQYENLKLSLWKQYEYNRDGYTNAKTDFIKKITNLAKEKYKNKYLPQVEGKIG